MPAATALQRTFLALVACVSTYLTIAREIPIDAQFKTGVTVTRVHVTVLEKRSRRHFAGLTAKDFIIKVDGQSQPITSVAEVVRAVSMPIKDSATSATPKDVTTNKVSSPRLFVIILNDAAGGRSPYYRQNGQRIANAFVDRLDVDDLAAVVFVRNNTHAQEFTADRVLLRRAIDKYSPVPGIDAVCPMDVVRRAQDFLRPIADLRRAIIFISPVHNPKCGEMDREFEIREIDRQARLAHIPIYTFSAQGLHAPEPEDLARKLRPWRVDEHIEELRTVSGLTGGRTFAHTNSPEAFVPAVLEELRSYYTIGFTQTYPDDGQIRRVQIQTTRADALVVSSGTVIGPRVQAEAGAVTGGRRSSLDHREPIVDALAAPLPTGDMPLRLAAVPIAVRKALEHAVVVTLALPAATQPERFAIKLMAFDGEGQRQVVGDSRDVNVPRASDGEETEVTLRLKLRPGRYNLRVAAERSSDKAVGSVSATVIIPDFGREEIALSGVAVGRVESRRIVGDQVSDLVPFVPTSVRMFRRTDRVGILVQIQQSASREASSVLLREEIVDARGNVIVGRDRTLALTDFRTGAAEHRLELPLQELVSGEYLLRLIATAGRASSQRDVRFEVR